MAAAAMTLCILAISAAALGDFAHLTTSGIPEPQNFKLIQLDDAPDRERLLKMRFPVSQAEARAERVSI